MGETAPKDDREEEGTTDEVVVGRTASGRAVQTALPLDVPPGGELGSELILADGRGATSGILVARPDRNLEKWPIWEPSNSRHKPKERTLQREIRLPDGSIAVARVEVGFTNKGALTTEDQKTCYALFKLWEERGKPKGPVYFSRQNLARVLKKSWGSKVNKSLTESLMRLRFTPFIWERSYYDSAARETVERIDTFNILSELHLSRRKNGEVTTTESSFFCFNERILANLLSGFTRPVFLDTILGFRSEIAQILYTHIDLVMADKTHYERRTKELFADLGIDGTTYRYPSKRAEMLEPALKELQGAAIPTGTLRELRLERTVDKQDFKIVVKKTRGRQGKKDQPQPGGETRGGSPEADGAAAVAAAAAGPVLLAPVVTGIHPAGPAAAPGPMTGDGGEFPVTPAAAPPETAGPSARRAAAAAGLAAEAPAPEALYRTSDKTGTSADGATAGAPAVAPAPQDGATRRRARAADDQEAAPDPAAAAVEQVRYFYQTFFQVGATARPTAKERQMAREHLERLGEERARYLVMFAYREAKKTRWNIQNYAGIAQYEGRATAEFDANARQRTEARSKKAREEHASRFQAAYWAYLTDCLTLAPGQPGAAGIQEFLDEERRNRERLSSAGNGANNAKLSVARRLLVDYDRDERRLSRFRDFLKERMEQGQRVEGVLTFWEWDAAHNQTPFQG